MALDDACYLASTDKIYGTQANYIIKFNATTGAKESAGKVCVPMHGPMRICGQGSDIYVSSIHDWSVNSWKPYPVNNHEIWRIDPTTLAVTRPFDLAFKLFGYEGDRSAFCTGPQDIKAVGDWMFILAQFAGYSGIEHIYIPDVNSALAPYPPWHDGWPYLQPQQFDVLDLDHYFMCDVNRFEQIHWYKMHPPAPYYQSSDYLRGNCVPNTIRPISCKYCPSQDQVYAVTGTEVLLKTTWVGVGDFPPATTNTNLSLATVKANCRPFRLRVHPTTSFLWIPCQKSDCVIIWDTSTDDPADATVIEGFASPVDIVFTGSKVFAVQSGLVSLKEIIVL